MEETDRGKQCDSDDESETVGDVYLILIWCHLNRVDLEEGLLK